MNTGLKVGYSKYERRNFLKERQDTFDEHLPLLFSSMDLEVLSGKIIKLIMKKKLFE